MRIAKLEVNNCLLRKKSKKIDAVDTCVVIDFEAGSTKIHYSCLQFLVLYSNK